MIDESLNVCKDLLEGGPSRRLPILDPLEALRNVYTVRLKVRDAQSQLLLTRLKLPELPVANA